MSTPPPTAEPVRYLDLDHDARRRVTIGLLLRITLSWVVLFGLYFAAPFDGTTTGDEIARLVVCGVVFVAFSWWQFRSILRQRVPQARAIAAVGALAALLIVLFSSVYLSLSSHDVATFSEPLNHVKAMYFTITTLTSVGYGDITPRTDPVRVLVSVQMIVNLILLGGMVRLLSLAARHSLNRADPSSTTET